MKFSAFSLSRGDKLIGDDYYTVKKFDDTLVAIVCDGVGSSKKGGVAAKRVANFLLNSFSSMPKSWDIEKSIKHFINSINRVLYNEGIKEYSNPEYLTTLALTVIKNNRLYGVNVGDSNIFLIRDDILYRLSSPHIVDGMEGVISEAIGLREDVDIYYFENNLKKNDILVLCSDGLEAVFDEVEIKENAKYGASHLIKRASKKVEDDLPDDTTAVVIEIEEDKIGELKKIDLPIPQKLTKNQEIDGFTLIKPLIQNERTWLAISKGKKYVLKFPDIKAIDDEEYLDAFIKEAWIARRLKAGFFPKAVIPKKRSYRYYVMEYIESDNLKNQKLSVDEAVRLGKFLLRMSQYLLKFNLVHGDIKPENILRYKNRFKVVDFGSITEIFSITKAGTPSYLSPERLKGEAISESSEIFAIGVTLYELLTKKYPYGEIEPFQNPEFKSPKPPSFYNKNIPHWLDNIILRAISIDKNKRYQHYSEMLYDLQNPDKVKPFFENVAFVDKNPLRSCKIAFTISFILNLIFLYLLVS